MSKRNKFWLSMQAVTFAGLATISACSNNDSDGDNAESAQPEVPVSKGEILHSEPATPAEGEGGGDAEAESSE